MADATRADGVIRTIWTNGANPKATSVLSYTLIDRAGWEAIFWLRKLHHHNTVTGNYTRIYRTRWEAEFWLRKLRDHDTVTGIQETYKVSCNWHNQRFFTQKEGKQPLDWRSDIVHQLLQEVRDSDIERPAIEPFRCSASG